MANRYDKGDRVNINTSTAFQDSDGAAFDPDVVKWKVTDPGGTTSTYTYGESVPSDGRNASITKNGTGDFTLALDVETAGNWYYRIWGETSAGENRGADEGSFFVVSGQF